jgi:hypothetical protein
MTRKSTTDTDTIVEPTEATDEPTTEPTEEQQPETDQVETAEEALITPYKAAQIILDELQLEIPPQMVYTYVKNGAFGDEAKITKRITATAAIEWGKALKERRAAKESRKQAAAKKDLEQPVDAPVVEVE